MIQFTHLRMAKKLYKYVQNKSAINLTIR